MSAFIIIVIVWLLIMSIDNEAKNLPRRSYGVMSRDLRLQADGTYSTRRGCRRFTVSQWFHSKCSLTAGKSAINGVGETCRSCNTKIKIGDKFVTLKGCMSGSSFVHDTKECYDMLVKKNAS